MMLRHKFTVPAIPIAQPRQRHRIVTSGNRTFSTNYTPARDPVNAFKAEVQLAFSLCCDGVVINGPVCLTVVFIMPRPKNKILKRKPNIRYHHTKKPDIDNLLKSLKDALNGLAWRDDSQVCQVHAVKMVADGDEQPHVDVEIAELI